MFLETEVYIIYYLNYPFQQKYGVLQKTLLLIDFTVNEISQPKKRYKMQNFASSTHKWDLYNTDLFSATAYFLPFKNTTSVTELCLELC